MGEWISVKDRMPEEGVDVLVYGEIWHNKKGIEVDFVKNGNFVACDEDVTHWMPLPTPPESEGVE
jgi:hypothetical protein